MAETILTIFRRNALRLGTKPCFRHKENETWKTLSWIDAEEKVRRFALGLAALGLKRGGRAAMLSDSRMEWTLMDLAILANQAATVPIYSSLASDQVAYILQDADCSLLVIENILQWDRIKPALKAWAKPIVLLEGEQKGFLNLNQLVEVGKSLPINQYDESLRQIQPSDLASVVYTSGTTGAPKGALITHDNVMAEVEGLQAVFRFDSEKIGLMCLPLAHVIARAMQFFQLAQGCQAAYAESLEKLPQNLREVRPHFMAGVPRLFEKSHEKISNRIHASPKILRKFFSWGLKVGMEVGELKQKKLKIPLSKKMAYGLVSLLIFRKIRKGFGGRVLALISGGAPLSKSVAQFFQAVGILVVEGYGLTETFAAVTLNRLDDFRFGTVGKPLEGIRIKISNDGEICVKGAVVFQGYLGRKEETEAAFDDEGWYLTGDIGEFTKDGFLRITDRKKDIIITSSGKNVSPQNIESLLQQCPFIQQAVVHGDGRKFLSALVTLNWEAVEVYARQQQIVFHSREELARHETLRLLIQKEIEKANLNLSSFETIKKFAILDGNFTIETGELTPTMKVKRKIVAEKYKQILEGLYAKN